MHFGSFSVCVQPGVIFFHPFRLRSLSFDSFVGDSSMSIVGMLGLLENGWTMLGFVVKALAPNAIQLLVFGLYRTSNLLVVFIRVFLHFAAKTCDPS
jgi:hypothetical protein